MLRRITVAALATLALSAGVPAQNLPPGYDKVVQITNDGFFNFGARINNRGQVVFARRFDPSKDNTTEIYLWERGALKRLTADTVEDWLPDINDAGEIVWSRAIGPPGRFGPTEEIVLWRNGQLTRLTDDGLDDSRPVINNNGWITWTKFLDRGCALADADIYLYDGHSIRAITDGWLSNQSADLNDLGDVVWTRYNDCNRPWTSEIMMYCDGLIRPLTGNEGESQETRINNRGVVAWQSSEPPNWNTHILIWRDGAIRELTDWGSNPSLNSRGEGDLTFIRWYEKNQTYQLWLYRDGRFWQVTDDPFWNIVDDINDRGDVVWQAGTPFDTDIRLLQRLPLGDLNCDRAVNNFDIDPFVLALGDPGRYGQIYPQCDRSLADINLDGQVDNFDIDPFVKLLTK